MSGDYSRRRFDPAKHYDSVLMQQGRVQLDSDWNEMVDAADRRWRAETIDILGRCTVPKAVPGESQDGFRIDLENGELTIAPGRIYVDGLLVENTGGPPQEFDVALGELRGTTAVPYADQPYFKPQPTTLPGAPYFVYLDAWQREITAVEDPSLVDSAVGVDTTTRRQTVWQVKLGSFTGTTCADAKASDDWTKLVRPPAGRLTVSVAPAGPASEPCLPAPGAGYTGLDNRLYRVEVHKEGGLGTAKFKWSRDNASVANRVVSIPDSKKLMVARTGRDADLEFAPGQWVEITNDMLELQGLPGEVVQVDSLITVEPADDPLRTIRLTTALTDSSFGIGLPAADVASRNTRIRRWDGDGVRTIPASGRVDLENGITATFTLETAGGKFRKGDNWLFAARTTAPYIEVLEAAPPRGTHHHYGLLAVFTADGKQDCRTIWPPSGGESCCTVVCHPGDDIQEAIAKLDPAGGCVCLKTGLHTMPKALMIDKPNVTIHGESIGATLAVDGRGTVVMIASENVTLADLTIELAASNALVPAVLAASAGVTLSGCILRATGLDDSLNAYSIGVMAMNCALTIEDCQVIDFAMPVFAETARSVRIQRNLMSAPIVGSEADRRSAGKVGILVAPLTEGCYIERNRLEHFYFAIQVGVRKTTAEPPDDRRRYPVVIAENVILRSALDSIDPMPADTGERQTAAPAYAIECGATEALVAANIIEAALPAHCGIRVAGAWSRIENNWIRSTLTTEDREALPLGIGVGEPVDLLQLLVGSELPVASGAPPDFVVIQGNRLTGNQDGIRVGFHPLPIEGVEVRENVIESEGGGKARVGIGVAVLHRGVIAGNRVTDADFSIMIGGGEGNLVADNVTRRGTCGISILAEQRLTATRNIVEDMSFYGIGAMNVTYLVLSGNRTAWCVVNGIGVHVALGTLTVDSCVCEETGFAFDGTPRTGAVYGMVLSKVDNCGVSDVSVRQLNAPPDAADNRALVVLSAGSGEARITGSSFSGSGGSRLVEITADTGVPSFRDVIFSNNRCDHLSPIASDKATEAGTVRILANDAAVMGNQVAGTGQHASFNFTNTGRIVAIGNTTTGVWTGEPVPASRRPANFADLNFFPAAP